MQHHPAHDVDPRPRRRLSAALLAVGLALTITAGACGSSEKKADTTTESSSEASSGTGPAGTAGASGTTAVANTTGLPDPCTLLSKAELSTVLVGPDDGVRQLSSCTWSDSESTAARLVVAQAKSGQLDAAGGKPLTGVGEAAYNSTAPGTVKIKAVSKGYELDLSVDTGTEKTPSTDKVTGLMKSALANLP
jgi:hypothetical protein